MFGSEIMGGSREDDFYLSPAASVRWKIGEQVERALKNHVADPKEASANCRRTQIGPACSKEVYNHGMISGRFKVHSEPSRGSTWPSHIPSRHLALEIVLPNKSSLARVVRGSFAIERFRRVLSWLWPWTPIA